MIIVLMLTIMLVLTMISVIFGEGFATGVISGSLDSQALINGSQTTVQFAGDDVAFRIDPIAGAIVILTGLIIIAAIVSVQILASGLSSSGSRIVTILIFYVGVWVMLSALAEPLIKSIEIFGALIYISMTVIYLIGVGQKVSGGSAE